MFNKIEKEVYSYYNQEQNKKIEIVIDSSTFIQQVNDMLRTYNARIDNIGEQKNGVLAYYDPNNNTISINRHCKMIFNDYTMFVEVAMHEEAHRDNASKGIEDVYMDGKKQIHTKKFSEALFMYGLFMNEKTYNGSVDFNDKRNKPMLEKIMKNKISDKWLFESLRAFFMKYIYEEKENNESDDDNEGGTQNNNDDGNEKDSKESEDNQEIKDEYTFNEEGGVEI